MRNRAIQMRIVNTETNKETTTTFDPHFDKKAETISRMFDKGVERVVVAVVGYVVVDTIRKVVIAKASK